MVRFRSGVCHLVVHKWALCWVGVVLGADDGHA
jgi:hypothetical protein